MPKPVKELTNIEIDEISLVDRPANQHAKVAIAKRAETEEANVPEEIIYDADGQELAFESLEIGDVVYDAEGNAYAVELDEEETDSVDGSVDESAEEGELVGVGKAWGANFATGAVRGLRGMAGPQKTLSGSRGLQAGGWVRNNPKKIAAGAGLVGAGAAGGYAVKKSFADEVREELSKAVTEIERDEVVSKALGQVDELSKRLEAAEEIAKSERQLRLEAEYYEVAKNYNVPVDPAELAPALLALGELEEAGVIPAEYNQVIHKALSAAGDALFEEVGFIGADNPDVMSQIDAFIDEGISKSADGISKADAMTEFFANNPAAYDEYVASRRNF